MKAVRLRTNLGVPVPVTISILVLGPSIRLCAVIDCKSIESFLNILNDLLLKTMKNL